MMPFSRNLLCDFTITFPFWWKWQIFSFIFLYPALFYNFCFLPFHYLLTVFHCVYFCWAAKKGWNFFVLSFNSLLTSSSLPLSFKWLSKNEWKGWKNWKRWKTSFCVLQINSHGKKSFTKCVYLRNGNLKTFAME